LFVALQHVKKFECIIAKRNQAAFTPEDYSKIHPTAAITPTLYGLPKVHKNDTPMRSILSSVGSGVTDGGEGAGGQMPPLAAQMWAPFQKWSPLKSASFASLTIL